MQRTDQSCAINGLHITSIAVSTAGNEIQHASSKYELIHIAKEQPDYTDADNVIVTHGYMEIDSGWSPRTLELLSQALKSMELDLTELHFNNTNETDQEDNNVYDRTSDTDDGNPEVSQF